MLRLAVAIVVSFTLACATPASTSRKAADVVAGFASRPHPNSTQLAAGPGREVSTCHPDCANGFRCNEGTATCEPIPCGGKCRHDQVCNSAGFIESCVAR